MNIRILQVCTGRARPVQIQGRSHLSAIHKQPVAGPVAVGMLGLEGDEQADLSVHGGLAKAVYAYPSEHLPFWQTVRAQARVALWDEPLAPGLLGENLLLEGVLERDLWVGDRLRVRRAPAGTAAAAGGPVGGAEAPAGGCLLVVSEPRQPCFKFGAAMGFAQAAKLMTQSGFCGSYLAVLEPGTVQAGDHVELEPGPREVGLLELFRARARR